MYLEYIVYLRVHVLFLFIIYLFISSSIQFSFISSSRTPVKERLRDSHMGSSLLIKVFICLHMFHYGWIAQYHLLIRNLYRQSKAYFIYWTFYLVIIFYISKIPNWFS